MVAKGNKVFIKNGKIEVGKEIITDFYVITEVAMER